MNSGIYKLNNLVLELSDYPVELAKLVLHRDELTQLISLQMGLPQSVSPFWVHNYERSRGSRALKIDSAS